MRRFSSKSNKPFEVMVKLIKGMFSSSPKPPKEETPKRNYVEFVSVNWNQEGRLKAQSHNGNNEGLLCCVGWIYQNHRELLRTNADEQRRAKQPYVERRQELYSRVEVNKSKVDVIKNHDIPSINGHIEKIQREISDIRKNPETYIGDKAGKAGFFIGGFILAFLTVYLFIFYSSASFSAFFKTFTAGEVAADDVLIKSIFDGQALVKAWNDGAQEFAFVLTIPFVFLGLGYLVHKFQESDSWIRYFKIAAILVVTFIFDVLIAYSIDKGIYEAVREGSFASPGDPDWMPPYGLDLAFASEKFWLIIFAGFVAYVIWGLVFDFVMEAYSKLDQISTEIKTRKAEIVRLVERRQKKENEMAELRHNIGEDEVEIERLRVRIEHSDFINPVDLRLSLMRFLDGWLEGLTFLNAGELDKIQARQSVEEFINRTIGQSLLASA